MGTGWILFRDHGVFCICGKLLHVSKPMLPSSNSPVGVNVWICYCKQTGVDLLSLIVQLSRGSTTGRRKCHPFPLTI